MQSFLTTKKKKKSLTDVDTQKRNQRTFVVVCPKRKYKIGSDDCRLRLFDDTYKSIYVLCDIDTLVLKYFSYYMVMLIFFFFLQ